jgi:hypothetical protein
MSNAQSIGVLALMGLVSFVVCAWLGYVVGRKGRDCFHHNRNPTVSWIRSELVDAGKHKRFWCAEDLGGCGQTWFF